MRGDARTGTCCWAVAAGVHGRWWNQVDQFDWVPPIDSLLNMGLQGMFESSWPMVVDQHGEQLGDEVIARLESYLPTVSDMFASFGASSRTLTHNDFRLDNMFFDDDDLVLIDRQLLGRGDGMGDVVPFLTCNLDPALRRAHESDLIDLYRDTLETMDAGYVHLDDLMNAYKLTLIFWLSAWLHNSVTKGETTQRGEELFERIITCTDAYVEHEAWASSAPTTSPRRCAELVTEVTIEDLKRSGAFSAIAGLRRPNRGETVVFGVVAALYLVLVLTGGFEPTAAVVVAVVAVPLFVVLDARNLDRKLASVPEAAYRVVVRVPDADGRAMLIGAGLTNDRVALHDIEGTQASFPQSAPPTVWVGRQSHRVRQVEFEPHGCCPAWSEPLSGHRPRIER